MKTLILGIGGAGLNSINSLSKSELDNAEFLGVNCNKSFELEIYDKFPVTGEAETLNGNIELVENLTKNILEKLLGKTKGFNKVILISGFGGGTGSGATPVIAKSLKDNGKEVTCVVISPFHFEGEGRLKVAKDAIKRLDGIDFTIIENQKIFNEADSNTTMLDAFKMLDLTILKRIESILIS